MISNKKKLNNRLLKIKNGQLFKLDQQKERMIEYQTTLLAT